MILTQAAGGQVAATAGTYVRAMRKGLHGGLQRASSGRAACKQRANNLQAMCKPRAGNVHPRASNEQAMCKHRERTAQALCKQHAGNVQATCMRRAGNGCRGYVSAREVDASEGSTAMRTPRLPMHCWPGGRRWHSLISNRVLGSTLVSHNQSGNSRWMWPAPIP